MFSTAQEVTMGDVDRWLMIVFVVQFMVYVSFSSCSLAVEF